MQRVVIDPDPYEPFRLSQAIRHGDVLYVSGQAGIDRDGILPHSFEAQAHQAFANLAHVLGAGGSDLTRVIKVTIFVRDMAATFDTVVALREQYFTPPYPADSIVEVSSLYSPQALFEIEAVAIARTESA